VFLELHPDADRARLLYKTAQALAYLRRCGIIHGDIKATNILVSDNLHALLCDFGLTKFASTSTSTALKSAGSLRWQAPELWEKDQPKTYQSDVYACGMTIVEVLKGEVPFAHCEQSSGVIMAAGFRNERPDTEPMFSPTDGPYYPTWRAAIHSWPQDPARRASIDQLVSMLEPSLPPRPMLDLPSAPLTEPEGHPFLNQAAAHQVSTVTPSTRVVSGEDDGNGRDDLEDEQRYCYCNGPSFGEMVACNDEECDREWFHLPCLGMISHPERQWFCLKCEAARLAC